MTTIAWDGISIAADRRVTVDGAEFSNISKIVEVGPGEFAAVAGSINAFVRFVEWIKEGRPRDRAYEKEMAALDFDGMVVSADGKALLFASSCCGFEIDAGTAIGSGWQFAKAAMKLGKNAGDAVRLACELDGLSGGDVEVVRVRKKRA